MRNVLLLVGSILMLPVYGVACLLIFMMVTAEVLRERLVG